MKILAIDPGPEESAYVVLLDKGVVSKDKVSNDYLVREIMVGGFGCNHLAIEMIASYGMPVGAEVFETCVWIGRFLQAAGPDAVTRITRNVVKNHLCHSSRANDSNIRQAIIDRFGGKEKAIGRKANQGPLFGISGDCWSALAVGLTYVDMQDTRIPA